MSMGSKSMDGDGASPAGGFFFDEAQARRLLAAAATRNSDRGILPRTGLLAAASGLPRPGQAAAAGLLRAGQCTALRAGLAVASGLPRAGSAAASGLSRAGQAAASGLPHAGQATAPHAVLSAASSLPHAGMTAATAMAHTAQTATARTTQTTASRPLRTGQTATAIDATRTLGLKRRATTIASSDIAYSSDPSSPVTPQSDPRTWDNNVHPRGGFMNLVNDPSSQDFHFIGMSTCASTAQRNQNQIDVDSEDEVVRTDKRILWTQEEDVRLMSAWLENSMDSISGCDKRNEQYWGDVAKKYNMTTPKNRLRTQKQAKDRWHKINKWTELFHAAWLKARRIYTSGYSDQMWIDKAHKFYIEDNKHLKLGPFVLMDVWYTVRGVAKWITYNTALQRTRDRKTIVDEGHGNDPVGEDPHELPRPMGQKKAKKMALEAKKDGQSKERAIDVDLEKYGKIQSEANASRLKVLEVQQKLSQEKLEASKLNHQAAVENKEAKLLEAYTTVLARDTSGFSAEEKEEHLATLRCLRMRLFPAE